MKNYTPPKTTFIVGNGKERVVCVFYLHRHNVMFANLSIYDSNSKKKSHRTYIWKKLLFRNKY